MTDFISQPTEKVGSNSAYLFGSLAESTDTTITTAGTFYTLAGTFTNPVKKNFTASASGITYTGEKTGEFVINWNVCGSADSNGTTYSVAIKKNNEVLDDYKMCTFCKNLGQSYNNNGTVILELEKNDVITIVVSSNGSGDVITVGNVNASIHSIDI